MSSIANFESQSSIDNVSSGLLKPADNQTKTLTHSEWQQVIARIAMLESNLEILSSKLTTNKNVEKLPNLYSRSTNIDLCEEKTVEENNDSNKAVIEPPKTKSKPKAKGVKSQENVLPFKYNCSGCQGLVRCHGLFTQCQKDVSDGQYCAKHAKEIATTPNNKLKLGTAIERQSPDFNVKGVKPVHYMKVVSKLGLDINVQKAEYRNRYGEDMPEEHLVIPTKEKNTKAKKILATTNDGDEKKPATKVKSKAPVRFKPKNNDKYKKGMRNKDDSSWLRYKPMVDGTYQLVKPETWTDEAKKIIIEQFGPIGSKLPTKEKKQKAKKVEVVQKSVFDKIKNHAKIEAEVSVSLNKIVNDVEKTVEENKESVDKKISAETPVLKQKNKTQDNNIKLKTKKISGKSTLKSGPPPYNHSEHNIEPVDYEKIIQNSEIITLDIDSDNVVMGSKIDNDEAKKIGNDCDDILSESELSEEELVDDDEDDMPTEDMEPLSEEVIENSDNLIVGNEYFVHTPTCDVWGEGSVVVGKYNKLMNCVMNN